LIVGGGRKRKLEAVSARQIRLENIF